MDNPRSVEIVATIATKVTFASHQNAVPILRNLELENHSDETLEDLTVQISADPAFLTPKSWAVDRLGPGDSTHILDRDVAQLAPGPVFVAVVASGGPVELAAGRAHPEQRLR